MILDNLLHNREAQSAAFGLSVAHKWLKSGILYLRWDTGAVIPDPNLQAGVISHCGYDDLSRVRRYRLTSIQDEVGNRPLETVGIKPAHGQALMMMLDGNASELLLHSCHADGALDCFNDVSDGGAESVTILGALKQRSDQFIHPLDGTSDFLVELVPFCLADI